MNYTKHVLDNGLRLIRLPVDGAESVTMMVMVGAGSRYEEERINGISHFLEHMAFKGTEKRPSALAIASTIDGIGAEFNAFTSKDHTGYYIKAAKHHLPLIVDVLSDMLLHSKFDPVEIEKERGVIIEEINMYEDTPMRKIGDLYENLMYGDTKLGRDIAGKKEVIKSVTREDFLAYINTFYGPRNTVVSISGAVQEYDEKKLQDLVHGALGGWESKEPVPMEKYTKMQTEPQLLVYHKDTQQAHIAVGYPSYHLTHPDRYALAVMTTILGGGMSSRLFIEVREKRGLAYYVRASNEKYQDVGNFVVQAGVDVQRIDDAIQVIIQQCGMIADGVTDEEFMRAKESLKGRFVLELEDNKSIGSLAATSELLEEQITIPQEIITRVDAVTKEDVCRISENIFQKHVLNLAVIGPYTDQARFEKILQSV